MVFLAGGVLLSAVAGRNLEPGPVRTLAELTLVVVLFHDASTVWLLPGIGVAGAVLIAAAITPTDAGLGAATILNPAVPVRVRRALNVESSLNDGLATPLVLAALAVLVGAGIGLLMGLVGAFLLDRSYARGLSSAVTRALAVLTLPILALSLAEVTDGNGFIAAFVAGITFGRASNCLEQETSAQEGVELVADLLGFVIWVGAGGLVVEVLQHGFRWQWLAVALAALTGIRAAAVAVSLLGSGFRPPTVAFLSWSGPRGLASIVFGLLALEELGPDNALVQDVTGVVGLTVLLSVVLHGATSGPLARRYGAWAERRQRPIEMEPSTEPMPSRGRGLTGMFPLHAAGSGQESA